MVDPARNLKRTAEALRPLVDDLREKQGWFGTVSAAPKDMCALLAEKDYVLYCGHGGGEEYAPRHALVARCVEAGRCASSLLMGCSSGRRSPSGVFEPFGVVDAHVLAGAPLVVANLWDVTDKDLDRFTLAAVGELFLSRDAGHGDRGDRPDGVDALSVVSASRRVCKLPRIVGAAPVCWGGIPWFPSTPSS